MTGTVVPTSFIVFGTEPDNTGTAEQKKKKLEEFRKKLAEACKILGMKDQKIAKLPVSATTTYQLVLAVADDLPTQKEIDKPK